MSSLTVTVRPALPNDVSILTGMARSLAESSGADGAAIDKDAIAALVFGNDRWAEALIAVDQTKRALGYVTVSRLFTPHDGARSLWVGDLYVMTSLRGQGVAKALMRAVAKRAQTLKCRSLVCPVLTENADGQAFYKACGLTPDSKRGVWRGGADLIRDLARPPDA